MTQAKTVSSAPLAEKTRSLPAKPGRADGLAARALLLDEAVRLFAEQGFARTSTRAIAQAADVNISAISYYFGDKEGLYRSAFHEPMLTTQNFQDTLATMLAPGISLQRALTAFFEHLLGPLFGQSAQMQHCMRLHMREMLEPTGLWQQEVENRLLPMHDAMQQLVLRHLGLATVDIGIQRLLFAIIGMPVYLILGQDVVQKISPDLMKQPLAETVDVMTRYALSLIDKERQSRREPPGGEIAHAG